MTVRKPAALLLSLGAVVSTTFWMLSCATVDRQVVVTPDIPGAAFVGNKACAECHSNYARMFLASPHARLYLPSSPEPRNSGCESCHGPGSLHIANGGDLRFIFNPGKDVAACFVCHNNVEAEFRLPHRHPVIEGKMNCVECHDPHGRDIMKPARGLAMARLNESCAECHREQARPVVFEHEALREGCTTCHKPHGAFNAKMLTEGDANLCLKCHAQTPGPAAGGDMYIGKVPHGAYLQQGTCWSAGCHSAVHGSNVNPHMRY